MKKLISLFIGWIFILSILTGCRKTGDPMMSVNQVGGFATQDEKWVYISLYYEGKGMIYKMSTDGNEEVKLCDDYTEFLSVVGDWIYYSNYFDGGKAYKIKTDGTEKTKMTDEGGYDMSVSGDWIYYLNNQRIYKIKTDGTNITKITERKGCYSPTVSGDWIYFMRSAGKGGFNLYRVDINGKNDTKLSEDSIDNYYFVDGVNIYYMSSGKFYSMKVDGSGRKLLFDTPLTYKSIYGEWIYYKKFQEEKLYKTKIDGSETIQLTDYEVSFPGKSTQNVKVISGDWIYFVYSGLYKMKTDGTELTRLADDNVTWFMSVVGDWVYYFNDDEKRLYKIRTDGTGRIESPVTSEKI